MLPNQNPDGKRNSDPHPIHRKQQLELDMEQWAGSKLGKESVKTVNCHPSYLTYMQSKSCEMLGWMYHKLESGLQREIPKTSDM